MIEIKIRRKRIKDAFRNTHPTDTHHIRRKKKMKLNLLDILCFFEQQHPKTNEAEGLYYYEVERDDGLKIIFSFELEKKSVSVVIRNQSNRIVSQLQLTNCSEINILDDKRKLLEIWHNNREDRCFVSLFGNIICSYDSPYEE